MLKYIPIVGDLILYKDHNVEVLGLIVRHNTVQWYYYWNQGIKPTKYNFTTFNGKYIFNVN